MFCPQIILSVWAFFYPWQNFTVAILSCLYLCKVPRSLSALNFTTWAGASQATCYFSKACIYG